jgi:hypothetical protein
VKSFCCKLACMRRFWHLASTLTVSFPQALESFHACSILRFTETSCCWKQFNVFGHCSHEDPVATRQLLVPCTTCLAASSVACRARQRSHG